MFEENCEECNFNSTLLEDLYKYRGNNVAESDVVTPENMNSIVRSRVLSC
jgi:hypothetical protein